MKITIVLLLCGPCLSLQDVTSVNYHISRQLLKTGFHRDVYTEVRSEAPPPGCQFVLEEALPAGCFVDIYQLQQMREFGGPEVWTESVIDLEKPEYLSGSNLVYVYLRRTDNGFTPVYLPVHLRYHRSSSQDEFAQVTIPQPRLLSVCEESNLREDVVVKVPCNSSTKAICNWSEVPYSSTDAELLIQVPVGQSQHQVLVVVLTLVVSLAGCVWLAVTVINKPNIVARHKIS